MEKSRRVLKSGSTGWSLLLLGVALVVGPALARDTSAQSEGGGPPAVLSILHDLQRALAGLQSSVDALGAPDQTNVRTTPPLFAPGGDFAAGVSCSAVNIADAPRTIRTEAIGLQFPIDQTFTLQPGLTLVVSGFGRGSGAYCRFTVLDGTRADIRGSMSQSSGGVTTAALPAE